MRLRDAIATSTLTLLVFGCVTPAAAPPTSWRPFDFDRDTFAFVNEPYWDYGFEAGSALAGGPPDDPDEYIQRCVVMSRAVRQFFYGARFAPGEPTATQGEYRALVRRLRSAACASLGASKSYRGVIGDEPANLDDA